MKKIDVLIPIAPTHYISSSVIAGLQKQDVDYNLHVRVSKSAGVGKKTLRITDVRNELRGLPTLDYTLMLDSDIVLADNFLRDSLSAMEADKTLGALGSPCVPIKSLTQPHIGICAMLIRSEILKSTPFRYSGSSCG